MSFVFRLTATGIRINSIRMEGIHEAWGTKVRKRREALGLTQEALAHRTGLRQSTISRVENGTQIPSDRAKWLLCGVLRCTLDELFPWPAIVPPIPEAAA